ncbi:MAG: hypothetical protein JJ895_09375 [Balneolaceae bacterium]|nr:hypothetical protein [Balneolaceae bacterium]
MTRNILLKSVCIICFLNACSLFENEQNSRPVDALIHQESLVIKNNLPHSVYYFALDQASLPLILWAPFVSDENKVNAGSNTSIPIDQLLSINEKGPIVVFYWDEDISEIFNIVIE